MVSGFWVERNAWTTILEVEVRPQGIATWRQRFGSKQGNTVKQRLADSQLVCAFLLLPWFTNNSISWIVRWFLFCAMFPSPDWTVLPVFAAATKHEWMVTFRFLSQGAWSLRWCHFFEQDLLRNFCINKWDSSCSQDDWVCMQLQESMVHEKKLLAWEIERVWVVHTGTVWCGVWFRHQGHEGQAGHLIEINTMCLICISQGRQIWGAISSLQFLSQFLCNAICHSHW